VLKLAPSLFSASADESGWLLLSILTCWCSYYRHFIHCI